MNLFTLRQLKKSYKQQVAFQAEELIIEQQQLIAFVGNSGSGKSTLLHLLASITKPNQGEIYYQNQRIDQFTAKEREYYLRELIDVIFQEYNLIDNLTIEENLMILQKISPQITKTDIQNTLEQLRITEIAKQRVKNVSGGQAQRVAIARALLKETKIILADEPTGALDIDNTINVMEIFKRVSAQKSILYVTHDLDCAIYADLIYIIDDGKITQKIINQDAQATKKILEQYFQTGAQHE